MGERGAALEFISVLASLHIFFSFSPLSRAPVSENLLESTRSQAKVSPWLSHPTGSVAPVAQSTCAALRRGHAPSAPGRAMPQAYLLLLWKSKGLALEKVFTKRLPGNATSELPALGGAGLCLNHSKRALPHYVCLCVSQTNPAVHSRSSRGRRIAQ